MDQNMFPFPEDDNKSDFFQSLSNRLLLKANRLQHYATLNIFNKVDLEVMAEELRQLAEQIRQRSSDSNE